MSVGGKAPPHPKPRKQKSHLLQFSTKSLCAVGNMRALNSEDRTGYYCCCSGRSHKLQIGTKGGPESATGPPLPGGLRWRLRSQTTDSSVYSPSSPAPLARRFLALKEKLSTRSLRNQSTRRLGCTLYRGSWKAGPWTRLCRWPASRETEAHPGSCSLPHLGSVESKGSKWGSKKKPWDVPRSSGKGQSRPGLSQKLLLAGWLTAGNLDLANLPRSSFGPGARSSVLLRQYCTGREASLQRPSLGLQPQEPLPARPSAPGCGRAGLGGCARATPRGRAGEKPPPVPAVVLLPLGTAESRGEKSSESAGVPPLPRPPFPSLY